MEEEVKVTDPTMSVRPIKPDIDVEDQIYEYEHWDSREHENYERTAAADQYKWEFLQTINAQGTEIANRTAYEIVRNAVLAERSSRISLMALKTRIEHISSTDIELIRKQRCINYYYFEILPSRRDLDSLEEEYRQLQNDIEQKYALYQLVSDDRKSEVEEEGKELAKKSKQLEIKIASKKAEIETKKKELIKKQRTTDMEIKESFNERLDEIRAKLKVKPKESVLSKIRPDTSFEKIDNIASIVSKYSELEAIKNATTLNLSEGDVKSILDNPLLETVKDCLDTHIDGQIKSSIMVTKFLADGLREKNQEYDRAYGKVFSYLMNRGLLDVFYSQDKEIQAKKYDPTSDEFEKMYLLYRLLFDQTISKDSEIESLMANLESSRHRIFKRLQAPEFVKETILKRIMQKDVEDYKETARSLDKKFRQFMSDFLVTIGVPELNEWISSLEDGIVNDELRTKAMKQATMKYDFLRALSNKVSNIYGAKVEPIEKEQFKKKTELFREIGEPEAAALYTGDQYQIPIVENYEDRAEVLRTIAAAQQTPRIDEDLISHKVIQKALNTTERIMDVKGQIDEDYKKTVEFSNGPRL